MNFPFDSDNGLVIVYSEIIGPTGSIVLRLALDTGATGTMINVAPLATVGYDPSLAPDRVEVTTGTGVEYTPRIPLVKLNALGKSKATFPVLAHTLPPSAGIDGLLGLDYLRSHKLSVDFREGSISLD